MLRTVLFLVRLVVIHVIGFSIAGLFLPFMLWRFIKSPFKFLSAILFNKRRNAMPACLNDPRLGTHGFVHLEEVKLHYVSNGDESKPLMLCLHGFPEFWYSWRFQLKEFKNDYRVVAVDMRGYSDSDKPSGVSSYEIPKLVEDIKQLIPALGHEKCVLVAHDWGGAVAWNFAMLYPEKVEKLVIMNCPHPAVFKSYAETHFSQVKKSWYMMFYAMPLLPELHVLMLDYGLFYKLYKKAMATGNMTETDLEAYKYAFSSPGSVTCPINYIRNAIRRSLDMQTGRVTPPTLIVWGRPDDYIEHGMAEYSSKLCDNATVKYIDNSNHFVQMSNPREINQLLWDFLQ